MTFDEETEVQAPGDVLCNSELGRRVAKVLLIDTVGDILMDNAQL